MSRPESHSLVLVADIGGTNARFALADTGKDMPLLEASIQHYAVTEFPSLEAAAKQYLDSVDAHPAHAVLAIAGHIHDNQVHATNNPWHITATRVCAALHLETVRLINDFAAQSLCLPLLDIAAVTGVGTPPIPVVGKQARQTFVIIGPGTGLGVGALLRDQGRYRALETEGGHNGFAPGDAEEIEILRHLSARFAHVSNERLISGEGLSNLYQALADVHGVEVEPLTPEQITARAAQGNDALCNTVLERFCAIFGAVAGDAVLHLGGWQGAYLAGGLAPKLLPWLQNGAFRERFETKGRLSEAMQRTPTVVITHPHAGLLGAAASALLHTI